MRTPAAKAFLQEALDASWLYRLGAAMRLGVPHLPGRNVIGADAARTSEEPAPPASSMGKLVRAGLLAGGLAASGAGGAMLANVFSSPPDPSPPPAIEQTTGDLLEWLDEKGYAP